ncbi:alpha/beta hydrolase family esterase [Sulfitobacter aestuariivivens]|uniref:Prolyl oligopeptidase family serine peptidase n=1 Tax=Sulfitobacter aestuariivivens TaxID=2766981 RepID=A0A927D6J7_9RHOB|nr:prolyl oligopeptidase family serine peptidase [Sulfitobacter aestuariivivens]MBD3665854.1 prolyl oligopeptidase family serine peptidase [Sulfitobacter aestuariivivens]
MRYLIFLLSFLAAPALACGPDSNCPVGDRHYRIVMPQGHDGASPVGALMWSHGYRGSAQGVMRNGSLRRMVSDAGLALIAMQGVGGTWDLPYGPRTFDSTGAAEFAYFDAVIADAAKRYPIDTTRIVASGFSAGGMVVWNLACSHPDQFAGFVPMSGTYWLRPPEVCSAPVSSIVHIHGDADKTVPLDGRPIRETKQGEVSEALAHYSAFGGFGSVQSSEAGDLACENRANDAGDILEFCLFPGGHSFRTEHLRYGIERLRDAGQI